MTYDSLIFDLDGTLWDASAAVAKAWNIGLREEGIEKNITPEDIHTVMGMPQKKCIEILVPELKKSQLKMGELVKHLEKSEEDVLRKESGVFYDGVLKGMQKLSQKYPLFLVSNCGASYMKLFLQLSDFGGSTRDYDCYGLSNVSKGQMLKNMVEKHGLKRPVYIGDTETDYKATQEAGMDFVFMEHGFGHVDGAVKNFSSFPALVAWLTK